MKYILSLSLLLVVFITNGQNRFGQEGISMKIEQSNTDSAILIFTLESKGENVLITDQFNMSDLNKAVVISPLKEQITCNGFIHCHYQGELVLKPGDQKELQYNIKDIVNQDLFVSRRKLPKGEVYWIVNGIQSESFFYEKR